MKEENRSYILGVVGGLIGGFIATIPWILVYVYGNMILSLLAIIIALGVLKGYQLFKGKVTNKLPLIIVIISCICVTISTFIIIPCLLLKQENLSVSIENFKILYDYSPFVGAIMRDYIISVVFTFLGIGGVVSNIRKQIYEGKTDKIEVSFINKEFKENKEKVKEIFIKLNAMSKNDAIDKEQILNELDIIGAKEVFNNLKLQGIIKRHNGKYYYSLKNDKSPVKRFLKLYFKICLLMIIVFLVIFGIIISL